MDLFLDTLAFLIVAIPLILGSRRLRKKGLDPLHMNKDQKLWYIVGNKKEKK